VDAALVRGAFAGCGRGCGVTDLAQGDTVVSGGATLYLADSLEFGEWPDVDVIITDPPYTEHTHNKQWIGAALTSDGKPRVSTAHKSLGFDPITAVQIDAFCKGAAVHCKRWVLTFSDIEGIGEWRRGIDSAGLEYVRACVWDKVDAAPQFTGDRPAAGAEMIVCAHPKGKKRWNGGGKRGVFRHAANAETGAKPHPSTKPLPLICELVSLFSEPGETVLDPFMGSGTTGVACANLGRKFIGIEIEPKYFDIACERIERAYAQGDMFIEQLTPPVQEEIGMSE